MSLFQNSVLNKYLRGLESEKVNEAYEKFTSHFHNPTIQENIRNSKEEQYQGEFLIDLFVTVFGYVKNPTPDFNLTTELKNIRGSKKTDGAILKGEKALAVIELKGTNTTDLSKVETQAFGYKNNQSGCNYVITSNFEKLRFYIDNAVDFEEFNLFQLTKERFEILWLCLSSEYLLKDIPKKIKDESLTHEEKITKELYKDYASFRNEVFDAIQKENSEYDKLTLFKKTQKLLDRFLFIFFAEDRLLLPPNSIRSIVNQWTDLRDKYDEYIPLYDRFKKYFGYMNTGHKGQQHDIFAYNGGLFAPDDILDNIKINDDLLYKHTVNLSNYDFESEVSVNILGHIFEHSLNDIEEIQNEIEGISNNQNKSKRKKDGVFYTPKYITKYIVENTIGKLCEERKIELDINDDNYQPAKQRSRKRLDNLQTYREWLLQITICDPACGSGAFLNQALEFLIAEHLYVDELSAKYNKDALVLSEVENSILENNLFGVDINDESIDIAKLSLWLRTAQKGRKLTSLNHNIKCGNSLIDNVDIAGDKAFNWQQEFPEVFANGGFDIIIGNPPYGAKVPEKEMALLQKYSIGKSGSETYAFFYEQALKLLKNNGKLGFITPDTWLRKDDFKELRNYLLENYSINQIIETGPVFKDARDTWCLLIFIENQQCLPDHKIHHLQINRTIVSIEERQEVFEMHKWSSEDYFRQSHWINNDGSIFGYLINEKQQALIRSLMQLNNIESNDNYLVSRGEEGSQSKFDLGIRSEFFMVKPEQVSKFHTKTGWYVDPSLLAVGKLESIYTLPKIFVIRIQKMRWKQRIVASLDRRTCSASLKTLQTIVHKEKNIEELLILEAILNSTLMNFWCVNFLSDDLNSSYLKKIPLPKSLTNNDLSHSTKNIKETIDQLVISITKLENYIKSSFNLTKLSRKLEAWTELDFSEFIRELNKTIKASKGEKLSIKEEMDWMEVFESGKLEAQQLKAKINKTDTEIDQMVYQLYELTEDEIKIVENANA